MKKLLLYFPVLLLVLVFVYQQYHIAFNHLSPWRGGGFGMYTTFHPSNNYIKITFYLPQEQTYSFTAYKGEWGKAGFQLKIFPHFDNFKTLADQIRKLQWVYTDFNRNEIITLPQGSSVRPELKLNPDSLTLSVYKPKPFSKSLQIKKEHLKSETFAW